MDLWGEWGEIIEHAMRSFKQIQGNPSEPADEVIRHLPDDMCSQLMSNEFTLQCLEFFDKLDKECASAALRLCAPGASAPRLLQTRFRLAGEEHLRASHWSSRPNGSRARGDALVALFAGDPDYCLRRKSDLCGPAQSVLKSSSKIFFQTLGLRILACIHFLRTNVMFMDLLGILTWDLRPSI